MNTVSKLVLVLLLLTATAAAQEPSTHHHDVKKVNIIDGSVHPEMVKDEDAYLLFLLSTISKDGSDTERARQLGIFAPLNLTGGQNNQLLEVLTEFAQKHNALVQAYNTEAEKAGIAGTLPDFKAFRQNQNQLVAETRLKLELVFGSVTARRFHGFIQGEKRNMKIAVEE